MDYIRIIALYDSGREEVHLVKKTKGLNNKELTQKLNALRSFPNIINVRIER